MIQSVNEQWRMYEADCVHPDAGPEQRREIRWAFHAGQWAAFWNWFRIEKKPGSETITQFARYSDLKAAVTELSLFKKAVANDGIGPQALPRPERLRPDMDVMTEPELHEYFKFVAHHLEEVLPGGPGRNGEALFVLLVLNESSIAQYVSNAVRSDIIKFMRETADRLEARDDVSREGVTE